VFTMKCPDLCSLWIVRISVHFWQKVTVDPCSGSFRRVSKNVCNRISNPNFKSRKVIKSNFISTLLTFTQFKYTVVAKKRRTTLLLKLLKRSYIVLTTTVLDSIHIILFKKCVYLEMYEQSFQNHAVLYKVCTVVWLYTKNLRKITITLCVFFRNKIVISSNTKIG